MANEIILEIVNSGISLIDINNGNIMFIPDYITGSTTKAYYRFNNNLLDQSSNGYNGISGSSTTYVDGITDKALVLSGSTYVCSFSNPVIPNGKKSIAFWMYDSGTPIYSGLLGTNYTFGTSTGTTIYSNGNGNITFQIRGGNADADTYGLYSLTSSGLSRNIWYWIICQWDGTNNANSARIYVNGILNAFSTNSKSEANNSSYNLMIGRNPGDPTRFWYGYIDELIIRNEIWTSTEIKDYYNKYRPI